MSKQRRKREADIRTAPPPAARSSKRYVFIAAAVLLLAVGVIWLVTSPAGPARTEAELAALQRPHAATTGSPAAPVHIVEFLDPACETCRAFYPYVKSLMNSNPGKLKLTIRMVAFHPNADVPVKALEASKLQGKFWEVLERLLASQPQWTIGHRVYPDKVWAQLQTMDLDLSRLRADMESPGVLRNVALDAQDAKTMKVKATPEYFVNGRGLPEFGYEQLERLVQSELAKAR